jgi:Flp pilus assembly protein TadB
MFMLKAGKIARGMSRASKMSKLKSNALKTRMSKLKSMANKTSAIKSKMEALAKNKIQNAKKQVLGQMNSGNQQQQKGSMMSKLIVFFILLACVIGAIMYLTSTVF